MEAPDYKKDLYRQMAGWEADVVPLIEELAPVNWERILQQVADNATANAGRWFRWRKHEILPVHQLILRKLPPAERALQEVAMWKRLVLKQYSESDALAKGKTINLRKYLALRLQNLSRGLGTYETQHYWGPQGFHSVTKWRLDGHLRYVLSEPNTFCYDRSTATVGKAIARAEWFQHCLREFKEAEGNGADELGAVHTMAASKKALDAFPKEQKTALLRAGISLNEVRLLLENLGIGSTYTKPGEWAAALRALHVGKVLTGTPPEVMRWANREGYVNKSLLSTLKVVWQEERSNASDFPNQTHATVYRIVSKAAENIVSTLRAKGE